MINSTKLSIDQNRDDIIEELNNTHIALIQSIEELYITATNLSIAQESLDLNIFSYDEGMISIVELLSSQISWLTAYNNRVSAAYKYHISLVEYRNAAGLLEIPN